MSRFLQVFNLLGVLALAVLCVFQWRINRETNLEAARLEGIRWEQSGKIDEQKKALEGCAADLDTFREQLVQANALLVETRAKVAAAEGELRQLSAERNQLKESVANWAAAVAARDEQLRQASEQLQKLATARDEAVARFNDLAGKYNAVVKDLNEARSQLATPSPARAPERPPAEAP